VEFWEAHVIKIPMSLCWWETAQ